MCKKVLSIFVILTLILSSFWVIHAEPVIEIPDDAITVTDQITLLNAINSDTEVNILLKNNVYLTSTVTIKNVKTLNFYMESDKTFMIYSSNTSRHFEIKNNVTFNFFGDVIIEGNGIGGGIEVRGSGFTFKMANGTIQNCASDSGGAINNESIVILNGYTKIQNNKADSYGGGIFSWGVNTKLILNDYVQITDNTAYWGGGVSGHNTEIAANGNVQFKDNEAYNDGGAIWVYGGNITLKDYTKIIENIADRNGGGIFTDTTPVYIYDNVLVCDNKADENGGGICGKGTSASTNIYGNAAVTRNSAMYGGGIYSDRPISIELQGFVEISNNTAIEGGGIYSESFGNITANVNVNFSGNSAESYINWIVNTESDYGDSLLHENQIKTKSFSSYVPDGKEFPMQFNNAYNNYDINYDKEIQMLATLKVDYIEKGTENILKSEIINDIIVGERYSLTDDISFNINGEKWRPELNEAIPSTNIIAYADPMPLQNTIIVPCSTVLNEESEESAQSDVLAKVIEADKMYTVYSVDIEWGNMKFVYSNGKGKWDPQTHSYDGQGAGTASWLIDNSMETGNEPTEYYLEQGNNKIKITNHSNHAIDILCRDEQISRLIKQWLTEPELETLNKIDNLVDELGGLRFLWS